MRCLATAGILMVIILAGCSSQIVPQSQNADEHKLFGPISMKLDSFSKVRNWTGDSRPDGIEALVEFDDRFGDRTKAAGIIFFELYDYRQGWPDPRGARLANPWTASLTTFDEQKAHWETASGAYMFRLAYDQIAWNKNYVLTATFQSADGTRFFSRIVIRKQTPGNREPTTNSSDSASS
jgi:hypothetical protein